MIIETSSIEMGVEHVKRETRTETRRLSLETISNFSALLADSNLPNSALEALQRRNRLPDSNETPLKSASLSETKADLFEQYDLTLRRLFEALINAINPRLKIPTKVPTESIGNAPKPMDTEDLQAASPGNRRPINALLMNLQISEQVEEYECTAFKSCGYLRTDDGEEIQFSIALEMKRSFSSSVEYSSSQVVFKDPLVLNFAGQASELTDEKYLFDLDADGSPEMISYLSGQNAMLALDRNEDGLINNGSELFGALTGQGFQELSAFDEDGNQFIDSGDSVFKDLKLWRKSGELETLMSLTDQGIGAIYLGSAISPFALKGEDNQSLGNVRSTGFYLTENGQAGTVQQIDLAV